ncbi:hypothetical protein UY3_14132 [Chelonia mydas]|uniref:Uncharacterized protein n=1 Tax=Chelonia mydas TaxID=8469 RepID=M7ATN4_CHEMY|nr:hypothetical protein UY3_14132 [Chelonia mydas]
MGERQQLTHRSEDIALCACTQILNPAHKAKHHMHICPTFQLHVNRDALCPNIGDRSPSPPKSWGWSGGVSRWHTRTLAGA